MHSLRSLGLVAALGVACSGAEIEGQLSPDEGRTVDVSTVPGDRVAIDPAAVPPEDPVRARRRMDLDQLDRAMQQVTGGIGWTETRGGEEVSLFVTLAQTLGKPDFLESTEEDLQATAMFQKFLGDAARSVCTRLVAEDPERPEAERTFFTSAQPETTYARNPEAVVENLQHLLLRFHGRKVQVDAPDLEPWRWLFESAEHVTDDQPSVWRTVCVGLFVHPNFYTY